MKKLFKLNENGTTVRTEIMAGITTFFAMVYILMVNANMFANPFGDGTNILGVSYGAIYIATAISAVIGPASWWSFSTATVSRAASAPKIDTKT